MAQVALRSKNIKPVVRRVGIFFYYWLIADVDEYKSIKINRTVSKIVLTNLWDCTQWQIPFLSMSSYHLSGCHNLSTILQT